MELVQVVKVSGGFAVVDHNEEILVAYRTRKLADQFAVGHTRGLFVAAEEYDIRRTAARAYLASRAARTPAAVNQLELF